MKKQATVSRKKARARILWFHDLTIRDVPLVGGKNASLGEMIRTLTKKGIRVPNGFTVTAEAYRVFLREAGIEKRIQEILSDLDTRNVRNLAARGEKVRATILNASFPKSLEEEIVAAYKILSRQEHSTAVDVAVRSSATAEDLPDASFAGQQETYLHIVGPAALLEACKKCMASLFTNRAISYRTDKGFGHFDIALSIGVQKMVRSDLASSGVMFSLDTESGFRDVVLINAAYGLGENVVLGVVNPDEFYVFKPTLARGLPAIISKALGTKAKRVAYTMDGSHGTHNTDVSPADQRRWSLTDDEILQLAKWAVVIEQHYKRPMDMEWAKDGKNGKLYIVQARPETIDSVKDPHQLETYQMKKKSAVLITGQSVGSKIGQGKARMIKDASRLGQFQAGEVLVTEMTDPDWEPIMKIASAIVTNSGGRTCHAAIVSRELGIPCVVGTKRGTEVIKTGRAVTVSCAEGEVGRVHDGIIPFQIKRTNLRKIERPKTKIMMNIGDPEQAFGASFIPNDGVGLAREEFITSNYIKIHPLALIHFQQIKDPAVRAQINELTAAYKSKTDFYVHQLAFGIGRIAAAFYPKPVIVRMSDFKSNEYANLIGGAAFEPTEDNPMIGWRGASRYYDPKYQEAFALECQAFKMARETMGLRNVKIMIPFCRTTTEAKKVLAILAKHGLRRGVNDLEVYVMCEIPSNVILGREFAKLFDGFSIGSNDLTQLVLGVDRDSALVSHVYNENDEAVKVLIREIIRIGKATGTKVGLCGQGPSDSPEFARFLLEAGIDSMSLTPDSIVRTMLDLVRHERQLKNLHRSRV